MAITHKYTIICDDVRQENTAKLLLIGVYTGPIGVAQIPVTMPVGLTFFQNWESDRLGNFDMKMKIQHLESGHVLVEARGNMSVNQPGPIYAPIRLAPLQFNAVGTYNLVIEIEGEREPVIVDFAVQLAVTMQQQTPQRR